MEQNAAGQKNLKSSQKVCEMVMIITVHHGNYHHHHRYHH